MESPLPFFFNRIVKSSLYHQLVKFTCQQKALHLCPVGDMVNCSCRIFTHLLKPDSQARNNHLKYATRLVPTLPVSMCSSLTERVHVTLWSHGNAIPVHCSYHGISSSLQQQTDQFKISCELRDTHLDLSKSTICSS